MIDLHVHSTVSDGSYTPAGLAVLAKESGVEAFALTDHDSIAGTDEAAAEAVKQGVDFINGMEMSLSYQGHKIHVVCLGFDRQNPEFQKLYKKVRYIKEDSMADVVEAIGRKGIDIDMEWYGSMPLYIWIDMLLCAPLWICIFLTAYSISGIPI